MVEMNVLVQLKVALVKHVHAHDVVVLNNDMETAQLWETYSGKIRRYIWARVRWPAVDDILQQVFLIVHEKYHLLHDKKATKSRIYRIAQNTIIDWYRKEYWWKNNHFDDNFWDSFEGSSLGDSKQETLARNISTCLLPMIDNLDEQTKLIMNKYLDDNMSHKMIADELWLTENNVKIIIHRTKKKLKNMYNTCCNQYRDDAWRLIDSWCRSNCWCDNTVITNFLDWG